MVDECSKKDKIKKFNIGNTEVSIGVDYTNIIYLYNLWYRNGFDSRQKYEKIDLNGLRMI